MKQKTNGYPPLSVERERERERDGVQGGVRRRGGATGTGAKKASTVNDLDRPGLLGLAIQYGFPSCIIGLIGHSREGGRW